MSKFNAKTLKNNVKTYEGGAAYAKPAVQQFFEFMFSSMMSDRFYEDADTQQARYISLLDDIADETSYEFVAKVCIFVRNELGIRSISQITAAWLNDKSFEHKRSFYSHLYHRADDPLEVYSAIGSIGQKPSHAFIRGTADYIQTLTPYELKKYTKNGHEVNMYDLINLCHPKPNKAIDDFVNGRTPAIENWETTISATKSDEEKAEAWDKLLVENKITYFALLRNLNNILWAIDCLYADDDETGISRINLICSKLTNENAIRKSLVMPFRFYTAYKNLKVHNNKIISALGEAFRISTKNMPHIDGKNLICVDVSGSMASRFSKNSTLSILGVSSAYAVALYLSNSDFTLVKFGSKANYFKANRFDDPFRLIEKFSENAGLGYSTEMDKVFELIHDDGVYDNFFVFSDQQSLSPEVYDSYSWWGFSRPEDHRPVKEVKDYVNEYVRNGTEFYSMDLGVYSTTTMNPYSGHVHFFTGLSDKVFEMIDYMRDYDSLIKHIDETVTF